MATLTVLTEKFNAALNYATTLHREQVRKGSNVPYVSHLLGVASIVLEHGGDEDEAVAALLHDAIEDHPRGGRTETEIAVGFGPRVLAIVMGCTDATTSPKPPWKERKEAYIAHIATASPSVRLVSAADKLHNARCILADYRALGDKVWERFKGGKEGTLWYYREVLGALFRAGGHKWTPLMNELHSVVSELNELVDNYG